ncbi:MAG: hypothetical protein GVX90_05850, partial [Alphaproteobacteria bacterium]|nr:hypothetical protein [Alphaproteobacteria bacterium]
MVLARALAALAPERACAAYEGERRERTAMIQLNSRLMGRQFQSKKPEGFGSTLIRDEEALACSATTRCARRSAREHGMR